MLGKAQELARQLGEDDLPRVCVIFVGADGHRIVRREQALEVLPGSRAAFSGEDVYGGAIAALSKNEKATVYFLTGHGERPMEASGPQPNPMQPPRAGSLATDPRLSLSRLVGELRKDDYEVKPLDLLAEGGVPEDCAVLVIAGPTTPLQQKEMDAVRQYLDERNGRAVVMVETNLATDVDSNVTDLLAPYGVQARTDAIGMVAVNFLGQMMVDFAVPVSGDGMADHAATSGLKALRLYFDQPCPLQIAPDQPNPMLSARPLLTGLKGSWGETGLNMTSRSSQSVQYDAGEDVPGPVVVAAVVQPGPPPGRPPMGINPEQMGGPRIVVIGSSLAFVNGIVDGEARPNLYFIQNCVNWLGGQQNRLGVPAKTEDISPATVSEAELSVSRYLFIGVLPACVIALGIAVLIVRRR
jgi:hypothetical protein